MDIKDYFKCSLWGMSCMEIASNHAAKQKQSEIYKSPPPKAKIIYLVMHWCEKKHFKIHSHVCALKLAK